jgi:hypothetical protein
VLVPGRFLLIWPIYFRGLKLYDIETCGLYYKPTTIVNDDSRVINKLEASLTDDARVVIYNRHMFIIQATGANPIKLFGSQFTRSFCKLKRFMIFSAAFKQTNLQKE